MRYSLLRELIDESDRPRVIRNLEALREQLSTDLPAKDAENHLLMATWNVRDLGKLNRRGYGDRLPESHFYIAEVFSRFDFVAVQEVNELPEWEAIMRILGPTWDFLATDVTDPKLGGNGERLTYLFDQRKVSFRHIAGEIVLPPDKLVSQNVDPVPSDVPAVAAEVAGEEISRQFARSPFVASFQSSWFRFDICTVHIYYGAESGEKLAKRVAEIREIADYFGARAAETLKRGRSLILLGDFNIVHAEHETMTALLDSGFKTPAALEDAASNIGRDKYYDQIAFKTRRGVLEFVDSPGPDGKPRAGVFEIFKHVFTPDQFPEYEAAANASPNGADKTGADLQEYYEDWRTYQFSDHLPMWVQLGVNDSDAYLKRLQDV